MKWHKYDAKTIKATVGPFEVEILYMRASARWYCSIEEVDATMYSNFLDTEHQAKGWAVDTLLERLEELRKDVLALDVG